MIKCTILFIVFHILVFPQGVGVGTRIDLTQSLQLGQGQFAQIFIPDYYTPPADGKFILVFHLHSASWAAENQVYRGNVNAVLFNIHLGALSSPYQNYFSNQLNFQTILNLIVSRLASGIINNPVPDKIILTSFSAGYAGVREILKTPDYYNKINALTLADGLHSNSDLSTMHQQMKDFVKFGKDARDRRKIFYLTHSSITTSGYQSTTQTANYLIDSLGIQRIPFIANDEIGLQYSRCDTGNFHLKGYNGNTADDHLKHLYAMHLMLSSVIQDLNSLTSADDHQNVLPDKSYLLQNFPNPFNPYTKIRFFIKEESSVSIDVNSINGEKIINLLSAWKSPGVYEIFFDGSGLPSGVYICTMSAGQVFDHKKILLIK
jgi:hypothetical protein